MVVAIGNDHRIPSEQAIFTDDGANFLVVFNPADYVSTADEFTTDSDKVTVTMAEGTANNVIRVDVTEDADTSQIYQIKFRNQVIMLITPAVRKSISQMVLEPEASQSTDGEVSFALDDFDESTKMVVKVKSDDYDADFELSLEEGEENQLTTYSSDLPYDFGAYLNINLLTSGNLTSIVDGEVSKPFTIDVISIDQNGQQIYP